ncbi:MAG: UDP-N-acetylmuramoyl-L-alanyl-D-glutamate--2,6-diaminopimelate ligase [bacterium]
MVNKNYKKISDIVDFLSLSFKLIKINVNSDHKIDFFILNSSLYGLFRSICSSCSYSSCDVGFIALKGSKDPLEHYLKPILDLNPKLVIADKDCNYHMLPSHINYVVVENLKRDLDKLLNFFYDHPAKSLNIFGITGTNGKTTTTTILYSIFQELSKKDPIFSSCLIGTVKYCIKDQVIYESSTSNIPLTTPDICTNYFLLKTCRDRGVKNVFMEVSSHSLDQERVKGIEFKVVSFTNLSREHLDYHKTMQNYFSAKKKLFTDYSSDFKIICSSNSYGRRLINELSQNKADIISFKIRSFKNCDYSETSQSSFNLSFIDPIKKQKIVQNIKTDLIGLHNFENLSIVYISCYLFINYVLGDLPVKFYLDQVVNLLANSSKFLADAGRLELVSKDPLVFIDYAHSPDALKRILKTLKSIKKDSGKLIVVFGAGGNRDKTKRPLMGKVASKYADIIILTSDNPRNEDPLLIIEDIKKGVKIDSKNVIVELDRENAIRKGIELAQTKDIVLIAGKGHEKYQIIGKSIKEFSDKKVALKCLTRVS